METSTPTLQSASTGKLIALALTELIEPVLTNDGTPIQTGISYIGISTVSPMSDTGHGTPPVPTPNSTTGHGTAPVPTPNSTTGHGTPPVPTPNSVTSAEYLTIGQIMSFGGIRSTTELTFQIQAHAGQKIPHSFAIQVLNANNQVLYQTDMTSFHGQNLGDQIVIAFDTEAAEEAANYFGLQNYLRVVTKTEDDMNKIQSVVVGKRSN